MFESIVIEIFNIFFFCIEYFQLMEVRYICQVKNFFFVVCLKFLNLIVSFLGLLMKLFVKNFCNDSLSLDLI